MGGGKEKRDALKLLHTIDEGPDKIARLYPLDV